MNIHANIPKYPLPNQGQPKLTPIIVLIVIVALWGIIYVVLGTMGLLKASVPLTRNFTAGQKLEGSVEYSSSCILEVNHTVEHFIPFGSEYYYIVFNNEDASAFVVRADKNWGDKFGSGGHSPQPVFIKGTAKRLGHDEAAEIRKQGQELSALGISLQGDVFLDLTAGGNYILMFIAGIGLIQFAAIIPIGVKKAVFPMGKNKSVSSGIKALCNTSTIIMTAALLLAAYLLTKL